MGGGVGSWLGSSRRHGQPGGKGQGRAKSDGEMECVFLHQSDTRRPGTEDSGGMNRRRQERARLDENAGMALINLDRSPCAKGEWLAFRVPGPDWEKGAYGKGFGRRLKSRRDDHRGGKDVESPGPLGKMRQTVSKKAMPNATLAVHVEQWPPKTGEPGMGRQRSIGARGRIDGNKRGRRWRCAE